MIPKSPVKMRPYWHVDLKWICGLLLVMVLAATLGLYNLSKLTERERAIELSATLIALAFSPGGLDSEEGVAEYRAQAAAQPNEQIEVPNLPGITVGKQDVLTLPPRDLRLKIFSQISAPIYDKGVEGAVKERTSDPNQQEQLEKNAFALKIFTAETHQMFQRNLRTGSIACVVLLGALVYFSRRWGRLVSPAIVLLLSSWPGALIGQFMLYPPPNSDGGPLGFLPPDLAPMLGRPLQQSYGLASLVGLSLLVIAAIGKLITRLRKHHASGRLKK